VNNLCRVSIEEALNDIPAGKYQRAIAEKTQELLEGRFNPLSDDSFVNFVTSDLSPIETKFWLMIRNEINKHNYDLVGRMVERIERIVEANTDVAICRVYDYRINGSGEKRARLIAAPPELLEALKTFFQNDGGAGSKCFNSSRLYEAEQAHAIADAMLKARSE